MCVACAMTAAAGASGARTYLQTHDFAWLTPRRLKATTVALIVAALCISTIGLDGSSSAPAPSTAAVHAPR